MSILSNLVSVPSYSSSVGVSVGVSEAASPSTAADAVRFRKMITEQQIATASSGGIIIKALHLHDTLFALGSQSKHISG